MNKWNMIVDVERCHNCNNCFLGCKDEYVGNDYPGYSAPQPLHGHKWINILTKERGRFPMVDVVYVPTMCNHCDDAPCVKAGGGAVKKREDGIVIIDPVESKGKKEIVKSCPYGAIWWNPELEIPQAWIFDAHLLDRGWKEPRCVQSCPTGALRSVKVTDEEMAKIVETEGLQPFAPDFDTKPRVHYKNLYRYNRLFIGANIIANKDGVLDCVAGAHIELISDGSPAASTKSDAFGEFRFDDLEENSGTYQIRITHEKFEAKQLTIELESESVVLDAIEL